VDATAQLTGVSHSLTGTQLKYLSSQRGRDRCISQSHGHSTEDPLLSAWTRPVYLTVSRALNRRTSPPSVDMTDVSDSLTGTQPKYLFSQRGRDRCIPQSHGHSTEVPLHSLTGTQPKYLSSQHGRDRCISPSHGQSPEVPLLSAWTRPVYLTVSRALNRSTAPLSVDATAQLTGVSHSLTTEVTLHSVWTRPVYPWALRFVY
jgi:hypothetical protein